MPKILKRVVAILMLPGLISDLTLAVTIPTTPTFAGVPAASITLFQGQALSAEVVTGIHPGILKRSLFSHKIFQPLRSLWVDEYGGNPQHRNFSKQPFSSDDDLQRELVRNLTDWAQTHGSLTWETQSRYGRILARMKAVGLEIMVAEDPQWLRNVTGFRFSELQVRPEDEPVLPLAPAAQTLGQLVVSFAKHTDGSPTLIIEHIQGSRRFHRQSQNRRKALGHWRRKTVQALIDWGDPHGVAVYGRPGNEVHKLDGSPISAYAERTDYLETYAAVGWETQEVKVQDLIFGEGPTVRTLYGKFQPVKDSPTSDDYIAAPAALPLTWEDLLLAPLDSTLPMTAHQTPLSIGSSGSAPGASEFLIRNLVALACELGLRLSSKIIVSMGLGHNPTELLTIAKYIPEVARIIGVEVVGRHVQLVGEAVLKYHPELAPKLRLYHADARNIDKIASGSAALINANGIVLPKNAMAAAEGVVRILEVGGISHLLLDFGDMPLQANQEAILSIHGLLESAGNILDWHAIDTLQVIFQKTSPENTDQARRRECSAA